MHKRPQKPPRVLTSRSLCMSETLCDRMSDLMSGQKSDLPLDPWGALGSSTGLPPLLSTRCHCGQRARKTAPAEQDKPTASEPPTSTDGAIVWEGEILPSISMGQEVPPFCLHGYQNRTAPLIPPLHSSPPKARLKPLLLPETLQTPALPNGHRQPRDGSPCTWACCWGFTLRK